VVVCLDPHSARRKCVVAVVVLAVAVAVALAVAVAGMSGESVVL